MRTAALEILPSPDFTFVPGMTPIVAGLRPFRRGSYRLEAQTVQGKLVIHNYGHGGAGISLSWGCAREVKDLLLQRFPQPAGKKVVVLGAGVMGLTAATMLSDPSLGMSVAIHAKSFSPNTTSSVAGGQWAPSLIDFRPNEQAKFVRILTRAFDEHRGRLGPTFGISRRTNYSPIKLNSFDLVPDTKNYVPRRELQALPFSQLTQRGFAYDTLLVEPPIFLRKLEIDLRARNIPFVQREYFAERDVLRLPADIIVNCTGLGSDAIWQDKELVPIKGQLALLPAQPRLDYLFSGSGYVFPRSDVTVVGGTIEYGFTDCRPDPQRCADMVEKVRRIFSGARMARLPAWFSQNE